MSMMAVVGHGILMSAFPFCHKTCCCTVLYEPYSRNTVRTCADRYNMPDTAGSRVRRSNARGIRGPRALDAEIAE